MYQRELDQKMSALWDKHGAFFAFSQKQIDEQKTEGVTYVSCGSGLIAPKENAHQLLEELEQVIDSHCQSVLEREGPQKIIHYELANHEAQISMDITSTVEAVECYGITREQVEAEWPAFWKLCVDEDLF